MEGAIFLLAPPSPAPSYSLLVRNRVGKCIVCGEETYKAIFSDAVVKTYICSSTSHKATKRT